MVRDAAADGKGHMLSSAKVLAVAVLAEGAHDDDKLGPRYAIKVYDCFLR